MTAKPTCSEYVHIGMSTSRCPREPRTEEQREAGMCGPHLAGFRRRQASKERRRIAERKKEEQRAEVQRKCDQLEALGIAAQIDYTRFSTDFGQPSGKVTVDPDELIGLLTLVGRR